MRFVTIGIVLFISAIFQAQIMGNIELFGVQPNLLIVLITCFALTCGKFDGAVAGLIAGLMQDLIMGTSVGGYTILGMYLGLAVGALNKRFVKDSIFVAIPFVFVATLAYESVLYFFALFFKGQTDILYFMKRIILPEAVYNAMVTIIIFPTVIFINQWIKDHTKLSRKY